MGLGEGSGHVRGKTERVAVPAMPMPIAVICCVLNFLVPGLGTIIAGFSVCCCARNEDMSSCSRLGSCCISFGIGLLQLITVALLLFGWVWSCIWGVFFIGMSTEYYHDNPPDRGVIITQQPQPQTTVVVQPGNSGYNYGGYAPQGPGYPPQGPGYPPQGPGYAPQGPGYHQQDPRMYPSGPHPQAPQPPMHGADPGQQFYGGEPPPPYTETPVAPTAPPMEKQ